MPTRRQLMLLLAAIPIALPLTATATDGNQESLWKKLQSGGHVVMIRHAATEPGVGDPPQFQLGDCTTQRNLSAQGRKDAARLEEEFRKRNIPIAQVLSSRWCRCLDTARLAFGKATPSAMLDSMFNDPSRSDEDKLREVMAAMARQPAGGNLVFVTHNQNIQAMAGTNTGSGELVVTEFGNGKFRVIGKIDLFGR